MKQVKYEDVRENIRSLDIFIFEGRSFPSRIIQFFTRSPYSHVGMAYRAVEGQGPIFLWHSTSLNMASGYMDNNHVKGVQLVELSTAIKNYKGRVYYRQFLSDTPIAKSEINDLRDLYKNTPYEHNLLRLLSAGTPWRWRKKWSKRAQSTIFCSELLTGVFKALGKMNGGYSPEETSPKDYGENTLVWIDANLGEIVEIVLT